MSSIDPLWYKDAVIYQTHVRAFCDGNSDGIGDFRGLTQKLAHLQDLGVTAVWLLPFFPSPLKDDGYDIADYTRIHPSYGTLADFKAFLREAHKRDLKVIIELVINHTSDQHPWFQRSRAARPGSKYRDFYVWSDTPDKYQDARIIFKDFETSNWAWDPVAQAYYWHRFYSHQPDLNFDNEEVHEAVFQVLDFWLSMGVDGLRLDAVPYLYEREGTNCENLPETHAFLRKLRAHVDRNHAGKMLLAEANQWPEDSVAYFGQGDECHTAFHFPVMPRMFMGLHMEDRFPIIDIMQQTPEIPAECQWAIFLRNHDELTLEMVTDEERDYMYRVYANNPRARINLGIRRRLAPLLGNNRRKMELLNSLLMSLPGTPVIYYGDEIGMGDNIYLGDRNGVRTPMQWSPDRNAGFSTSNPQQLYFPVIIDHEYHYEAVNVETMRRNPASLYWWMKRLIALRLRHKVFGRGTLEFLLPDNSKVLAFLRKHEGETVLVVANLSRFSQFVELDLSEYWGVTPLEMFGRTPFPKIGELSYLLTLGPHAFYWFLLTSAGSQPAQPPQERAAAIPVLELKGPWTNVFQEPTRAQFERLLPEVLASRRWFGGKAKSMQSVTVADVIPLKEEHQEPPAVAVLIRVEYSDSEPDQYLLPLAYATGERMRVISEETRLGVAHLKLKAGGQTEEGVLFDAAAEEEFARYMLEGLASGRKAAGKGGRLAVKAAKDFAELRGSLDEPLPPRPLKTEQSNTSVAFDERLILKLFRRIEDGVNPDLEISAALTEAGFPHSPRLAGHIEYLPRGGGEPATAAIFHEYVRNQGDAYSYTLDAAGMFFEHIETEREDQTPGPELLPPIPLTSAVELPFPSDVGDLCDAYPASAALLGQRTAEMHQALASISDDPAFAPEPFSELYQRSLYQGMRGLTRRVLRLLKSRLPHLPEALAPEAQAVLEAEPQILEQFQKVVGRKITGLRIRTHGDYHLGQVLYTGKDFKILDFEGEPLRPLGERRIKRSPLRDVAGMLRSFDYASQSVLLNHLSEASSAEEKVALQAWSRFWTFWVGASFLREYLRTAGDAGFLPRQREELQTLLNLYLLEKAVYELAYELQNRPDWVRVPLAGIRGLLQTVG